MDAAGFFFPPSNPSFFCQMFAGFTLAASSPFAVSATSGDALPKGTGEPGKDLEGDPLLLLPPLPVLRALRAPFRPVGGLPPWSDQRCKAFRGVLLAKGGS